MTDNALIEVSNTVKDLMLMADMPKDQIKREMDQNYLSMLVKQNPALERSHFVEFITKCQLTGADPRLNQIYLIVHNAWNSQKQTTEPKGTTVFSYQFFLRLAQQTGELEDMRVEIIREPYLDLMTGKERASITARCIVKRKGKGETVYQARFWEFAKTDKSGNLQGNWKASPYLMLEKCAVANALRWAFPEVLGNLYIADEMEKVTGGQQHHHQEPKRVEPVRVTTVVHEPVQQPPQPELKPIQSDDPMTLEEMKEDMLGFLKTVSESFFQKMGKDRDYLTQKVKAETDYGKAKSMYDFIMRIG